MNIHTCIIIFYVYEDINIVIYRIFREPLLISSEVNLELGFVLTPVRTL